MFPTGKKSHLVKNQCPALTKVTQWVGRYNANQRVTNLFPSQGKCLGCRSGPQLGACVQEATNQCISPSLTLFLKINKIFFF